MAKPSDVKIWYRKGDASLVTMKVYRTNYPTDVQTRTKEVPKYVRFLAMSNPPL